MLFRSLPAGKNKGKATARGWSLPSVRDFATDRLHFYSAK